MTTTPITTERSVQVDAAHQQYRVPSCLGRDEFFTVSFDDIERELAAFVPWLREHDMYPPPAPCRATIEWYTYWKGVLKLLEAVYQLTGEQHQLHLIPQLVGLEGCRVRVKDDYGCEQTFTVMRSATAVPYHEVASPERTPYAFDPIVGYPFQKIEVLERDVWATGEGVG